MRVIIEHLLLIVNYINGYCAFVLQINSYGTVSFDQSFLFNYPDIFPTSNDAIRNSFVLAPFWSVTDLTLAGEVRYQTFSIGDGIFETVNNFIRFHPSQEITNSNFTATWMLVVQWDSVRPFVPENASQSLREIMNSVS